MFKKLKEVGLAVGIIFIIMVVVYALSWIATSVILYLITLCFGWTFNWTIATGIWLIIIILKSIFSHHTTVKK